MSTQRYVAPKTGVSRAIYTTTSGTAVFQARFLFIDQVYLIECAPQLSPMPREVTKHFKQARHKGNAGFLLLAEPVE